MVETTSPDITLEQDGSKGRYVAKVDGITEPAELVLA